MQSLQLFEATVEPGSSLKADLGRPPKAERAFAWPLGLLLLGVALLVSGAILAGLLVAVVGVVWSLRERARVEAAKRANEEWQRKMICLVCKKPFVPAA
ncbi:hypothetical protein OG937_33720 [Streptomyces sp. NBC_00510]